jgi:crossover junction endodeoxyribonuclease RusA
VITLTLPWPPSVNHYWRSIPVHRRHRLAYRVVLSREGRAYREAVCRRLASIGPPLDCRLRVWAVLHPPSRRSLDIDNRLKALLDSMQHAGVYRDDGQIDHIEITRGQPVPGGKAVVSLEEIASP